MARNSMIVAARTNVRLKLNRIDNESMRSARRLLREFRSGDGPDVVFFSDSTASWVAPSDTDRRPLHLMIANELGPNVKTVAAHGAAYHAGLFIRYVRLAMAARRPPVFVVTQSVMAQLPLAMEHPVLGYKDVIARLDTLNVTDPLHRYRTSFGDPTAAQYAEYHRIRFPTLAGDMPVGEYLQRLGDPEFKNRKSDEHSKLVFAFRHTADIADGPGLPAMERLGQALRDSDAPLVTYQTVVPVEFGARHLGSALRVRIDENYAQMDAALSKGLGRPSGVLATAMAGAEDFFIAPHLAREHLTERGRHFVTSQLVPRIQAALTLR